MIFFRCFAIALPHIFILLLLGGANDMLGGWNQTDDAMGTVVILFLLSPVAVLALLVTEIIKFYKARQGARGRHFFFVGIAVVLLAEALVFDLYFLFQLRM